MPTLDWIGKQAVIGHHREVPYHLLRCDRKLSVGDPGSGNLLVQGDNLLALKALLPYYAGQVKCVYIGLSVMFADKICLKKRLNLRLFNGLSRLIDRQEAEPCMCTGFVRCSRSRDMWWRRLPWRSISPK